MLIINFINNVTEIPRCKECGKTLKFGRSLDEGFPTYCSLSCTNKNKEHINKVKNTNLKNHGVICSLHIPSVIEQTNITMNEKYGVDNYFKLKDKIKEDCLNKLVVNHPMKLKSNLVTRNNTNLTKYNVKNLVELDRVRKIGFKFRHEKFIKKYEDLKFIEVNGYNLSIKCLKCGNIFQINRNVLYHRNKCNIEPCTICNPINSGFSYHEKEIGRFIKDELSINIIENDRKLIKPYEIDILIPEKRLGIEYNGLYWHSDVKISPDYHQMKTNLGIKNNIQILHIFQDEWLFKKDIVKSIIKSKMGIYDKKIDVNDCIIKKLGKVEYSKFLEDNYIDGNVISDIRLGVFNSNELILVVGLNKVGDDIEIIRFCNKINTITTHVLNKILNYIETKLKPNNITTTIDLRFSNGNLFLKYGFLFMDKIAPDYWFVNDLFRIDKNETNESENLAKIYDCGKLIMLKKIKY